MGSRPITRYIGKGSYFSLVGAGVTFTGRSNSEILKVESVIQPGDEGAVTDNSLWTFNVKEDALGQSQNRSIQVPKKCILI